MSSWPQAAFDLGRKLWLEGQSATFIRGELKAQGYEYSRNAILGMAWRRWGARTAPKAVKVRLPRTPRLIRVRPLLPKPPKLKVVANKPEQPPELDAARGDDGAPLVSGAELLKRGQCRWPIGDPKLPGFGYCARPAETEVERDPYCACHRRLARRPGTAMTGKKRAA